MRRLYTQASLQKSRRQGGEFTENKILHTVIHHNMHITKLWQGSLLDMHPKAHGRSASVFLGGSPFGISFAFFFSSNINILKDEVRCVISFII